MGRIKKRRRVRFRKKMKNVTRCSNQKVLIRARLFPLSSTYILAYERWLLTSISFSSDLFYFPPRKQQRRHFRERR